jgi:NADH-quinone oxidoreductase subunit F
MEVKFDTILSEFEGRKDEIIPILHKIQGTYHCIPLVSMPEVARYTHVPESQVYGVTTFYSQFQFAPQGKQHIMICRGTACRMSGGTRFLAKLESYLGIKAGETSPDGATSLEVVECLGLCDQNPSALVNGVPVRIDLEADPHLWLASSTEIPLGTLGGEPRWLTGRCGVINPTNLEDFESQGGFAGFKKALAQSPAEVTNEIVRSGLSGRGGAAFPTGLKWRYTASAPGDPKYIICNADESEPGTFKDRLLMEGDPFSIIEAMLIAGYAIGAPQGYIYIRGEYPRPTASVQQAIETAYAAGYLGQNISDSGFNFDLEIRSGAGAYICGEETALFESIEGQRGMPRAKPPFPTTNGLFDKPTMINNVETLCAAAWIMAHGAEAYRTMGTENSPGTKLFCLSGDITNPGVYEAPFGIRLGDLLDLAGSAQGEIQAILLGGAAGAFARPDQLDLPMSFEGLKAAGLPLGSGVVMVINTAQDLREVLHSLALFFTHESCGKCFPCRLGTRYQLEISEKILTGTAMPHDLERLITVGETMTQASFCGLGQTAFSAMRSALKLWPEIFIGDSESEEISV